MKPFERPVNSQYGAPMGRKSDNPNNFEGREIRIARVPMVDGAYDPGGAYWGPGTPLYCVYTYDDAEEIVYYQRAENRQVIIADMQNIGAII